ncbi:MAG: SMC family ATPase, partial [Acidimicrobiia bacterium]|nr:SMC family ATPase [Acidimicrobiia bacterium]
MRPVSVTMVGFGTFADSVTVDFEGADVFALVGPTGSGKSTVIDAMCFALYGSLPRYDDRRAVGAAVHTLAAEARVSLTFDLGTQRYVAVRVVRRDKHGKASTKEARLERSDGEVLAGTAREMEGAVTSLIGLDFDQFTRAVVLPQGDFARFLHDKPAARQDLLVQLLGLDVYERMMQRARSMAATEVAGLARDQERVESLAHATPERVSDLAAHAQACRQARESWRSVKGESDGLLAEVDAAEQSVLAITARQKVLGAVRPPEEVTALSERIAAADAARAESEALAAAADAALTHIEARIAAAGDRAALVKAQQLHADLAAVQAELEPREAEKSRAAIQAAELVAVAERAEAETEALRTANAAHVVREHLVLGEACPVCEQTVTALPGTPPPEAWRAARDASVAAREQADAAAKQFVRSESRWEETSQRATSLAATVADLPGAEVIATSLATLDDLERQRRDRRDEEQRTRQEVRTAREASELATRDAQQARARYRELRDRCAGTGLVPPPETDDLGADWERLTAWAGDEAVAADTAVRASSKVVTELRATLAGRLETIATEAVTLGLTIDADDLTFDALIEAVTGEERVSRERLDRVTAELEERTKLT